MRVYSIIPAILLICSIAAAPAWSATVSDSTANKALRRLPKAEGAKLAKIVAIGGTPVPETWHILTYDADSETGIKERIVADGAISDAAEVSEHAGYLTEDDVIGRRAVKIDTDRVFHTANQYALANDVMVASMNYSLEKNALGEPVWQVDCIDENDAIVGSLALDAGTGEVLSQDGFAIAPTLTPLKQTRARRGSLKLTTEAEPIVGVDSDEEGDDLDDGDELDKGDEAAMPRKRGSEVASRSSEKKSSRSTKSRSVRKGKRTDAGDIARTVTRPVRRVLKRVLPF